MICVSEFNASATGRRFGCPGCGGGLRYDIASGKMICDHCGEKTELSAVPDLPVERDQMEVTEFHCPQCGAVVYSTDTAATGFCSFCGSDVILTGRLGRARRPALILPFAVTREDCEARYREHLKHYLLMPGELKSTETISHFRPVYVPFWSYHVRSSGLAELKGTKSYTRGDYRYTEEYDLSMNAEIDQRGILYDASTAFEDETAAMLQHTASGAVPFHGAYLSGFYAQTSDVPAETYEDEAAATAVRLFMDRVKEQFVMDSVEMVGDVDHAFGLPDARYEAELIMLPVWLLAHRQGERVIYTAVNGRDGKVVCDVPVSNWKVAAVIGGVAVGFFALLQALMTLKPNLLLVLCGLILALTQTLFGSAMTALKNRQTRAFEPDFSGGRPSFVGPAQAMLKRSGNAIAAGRSALGKGAELVRRVAVGVGFAAVVIVVSAGRGLFQMLGSMTSLFSENGQILLSGAMLIMLVIMGVQVFRKARKGEKKLLPRILSCLLSAAGLFLLLVDLPEDTFYYGCAAAMLLCAVWSLVTITRAHNEYASRPVPFFEGEKA